MPTLDNPDTMGVDPKTKEQIVTDDSWRAMRFWAQGQPEIAYVPVKNLYFDRGNKELTDEQIVRWPLRWKYSKVTKDAMGKSVDAFPPTMKNIEAKRAEMAQEGLKGGRAVDFRKLVAETSPTYLEESAAFQALLDKRNPDERLAARLNAGVK